MGGLAKKTYDKYEIAPHSPHAWFNSKNPSIISNNRNRDPLLTLFSHDYVLMH
jgi:hypothetical protein